MIAIKGMEMPNSCSECNLTTRRTWNYACSINLKDIDCAETKRPKDCPLVEVDTCEDAISRKSMLDYLKYLHGKMPEEEFVKALPSVTPACKEERWIPCSERLPRKNGFYLCTTKDCITILEFRVGNPHYHEKPSFVSDVLGRCNSYVVAWMPLPKPYKAEMEREE